MTNDQRPTTELRPTERFSDRVADYVRYRPTYPPELLECLRRHCGLTPQWVAADIGSGTGLLTRIFLENGNACLPSSPTPPCVRPGKNSCAALLSSSPGKAAPKPPAWRRAAWTWLPPGRPSTGLIAPAPAPNLSAYSSPAAGWRWSGTSASPPLPFSPTTSTCCTAIPGITPAWTIAT